MGRLWSTALGASVLGAFVCVLIGSVVAAAYTYRWMHEDVPQHSRLLEWDDAAVVAQGKTLYAMNCAGCHGANGEGQTAASGAPLAPPHDGSGHTWQHPDFALVQLTKDGVSTAACLTLDENAMPRFEQALTDREILDILSYIKSTWPAAIRAKHDEINSLYSSQNAAIRDLLDLPPGRRQN